MSFDVLAQRIAGYHAALVARGDPAPALAATGRFVAAFAAEKPARILSAAAKAVDGGEPLPDGKNAVMAFDAARELNRLIPLLEAWRAPKAAIATASKLAAFLTAHPQWSLASIEIIVAAQIAAENRAEQGVSAA